MTCLTWERKQFKDELLEDLKAKARRSSVFKKWRSRQAWFCQWIAKPSTGEYAPYDFYKVRASFDNDEAPGESVTVEMILHDYSTSRSKSEIIRILKVVLADAEANISSDIQPMGQ